MSFIRVRSVRHAENSFAKSTLRRLYCQTCQVYMHCDVMAGHNMSNIIKTHLLAQTRPLYLQPVDDEGHYPWMEDGESSRIDTGSSCSLPSKDKAKAVEKAVDLKPTVGPVQRGERKSTDGSMSGDNPVQEGKKRRAVADSKPRMRTRRT
ncbi:MAG: hypothetical protein J3R72DRAFT_457060 [Linnemannia gamsii]|nr:MAG: hypothetical protein J3R72DRAFT_457060 [Linnemannia gamsii]